jgi:GH24 family phage-related lysozyme (muramidase)
MYVRKHFAVVPRFINNPLLGGSAMKTSQRGVDLIAKHEGFVGRLYNDPVGHCTVGFGHLVHLGNCDGRASEAPFKNGLTRQEGEALLRKDIARFEANVNSMIKVPLTQNQFDALVSFTFNLGPGRLQEIAPVLNAGKYTEIPALMMQYVNARRPDGTRVRLAALERRRREEAELFSRPIGGTHVNKRLIIPWVSQLGPGADYASADCGMACLAQLTRAFVRQTTTVDELARLAGLGPKQNAHITQHVQATAAKLGIRLDYKSGLTVKAIEDELRDNRSVLLLVFYPALEKRYDANYRMGHYITVHGMSGDHFFYDDPYWRNQRDGEDIRISKTKLMAAANQTGDHFRTPGMGLLLRSHRLPEIGQPARPPVVPPAPAPVEPPKPQTITVELPVPEGATGAELWWFAEEWARVVRDVYGREDVHNYLVEHIRPALIKMRDAA